jgi:hypothetical protein
MEPRDDYPWRLWEAVLVYIAFAPVIPFIWMTIILGTTWERLLEDAESRRFRHWQYACAKRSRLSFMVRKEKCH